MRKLYTLLAIAFIGFTGNAQIVNIPDTNFKNKLLAASATADIAYNAAGTKIKIDTNSDGNIQLSEAVTVSWLNILNSSISDLTGIEAFTNLTSLNCSGNLLTSLNLDSLTNLQTIVCGQNNFTSLDFRNVHSLTNIQCTYGLLSSIQVSGLTNLTVLNCEGSQVTSINLTGLPNLTGLNLLTIQPIASLDLTGLTNLTGLSCNGSFSSIDFNPTPNLHDIILGSNQLTSVDFSSLVHLANIQVGGSQLSHINLGYLPNLGSLYCPQCALTSLDVSGCPNLGLLNCSSNNLTYLNIKNGTVESNLNYSNNPTLEYICVDDAQLLSVQSDLQFNLPTCHANSYCFFHPGGVYYTVQGNVKFDGNGNGCDSGDNYFANFKMNYTRWGTTGSSFPFNDGNYTYDIPEGDYTVTPVLENPNYFSISPTSIDVSFPTQTSPLTQNFCVTTNGVHPDLEVTVAPLGHARPGYDTSYAIIYRNKGNQQQSGTIDLTFEDAVMDFVSAQPAISNQTINHLSWNFSNMNMGETRYIVASLNLNSPTETPAVNDGDILHASATISGGADDTPNDNTSQCTQTVVNSFDPNDKICIEGTTVSPSMVGEYVHYIIRFENNGTAPAQNIVVKDVIDNLRFDYTTLIPLGGSHPFRTKITNYGTVEFIFENINLPFDDANNDGYVAFKVKTIPTLTVGDTFSNNANIYFDYNFPIATNTYTTAIAVLGNQDFDFDTVFSLSPVPAKNSLTITTRQDVIMSSVNIYNTLGQLIQVNTNPSEIIDVSGLGTGTYFIKIISDKGTASSKFVKE